MAPYLFFLGTRPVLSLFFKKNQDRLSKLESKPFRILGQESFQDSIGPEVALIPNPVPILNFP